MMRNGVLSLGAWLLAGSAAVAAPPTPVAPAAAPTPPVAVAPAEPAVTPLAGGHIFISPMGEPFHGAEGVSGAEEWFRKADANHDNRITPQEFEADALRFFATLDTDHDGEIGPDEITHYESDVAPEIRVLSTYGNMSLAKTNDDGTITPPPYPTRLGAGRYGFLDMPEPVVSADANFDRGISKQEFSNAATKRFRMLDANGDGVLTRDELPKLDTHAGRQGGYGGRSEGGGHSGGGGGGHHGGHGGGFGGGGGYGGGGFGG
ncbi:MAG TPA: hypothetical protein VKQ09_09690 [Sphingomonas sp.]|nr:hypothetical protein [Sphingomonas sp.]